MSRVRWMALAAALVVLPALGCVGTVKTPTREEIEPLPPSIHVVGDAVDGCKGDGSGFRYRFLILDTTDLSASGPLATHLRARDYDRSIMYMEDLPWATVAYDHRTVPLRLTMGPLTAYLAAPLPHQGPRVDEIDAGVREHPERYTLVAMRPSDFLCDNLE